MNHTVETFIAAASKDFENFKGKKLPNDNLNKMERRALSDLQKREDIIITKTDKGGATVIIDVEDYIREANSQLENTEFYEKLNFNPTEGYSNIVDNRLDELTEEGDLSEEIAEGLKTDNPRTPHFYLLPKIHKEGNPGRPVVSSIDSHTSKISKYVDYHIQPIAKVIKSCVQDTSDFIEKINQVGTVPENTYLVSMDVRSLYTNIPNEEGIEALEESLDTCQSKTTTTKIITTLMWLILTLNNFIFNGLDYLQIKGCSMGSNCSPSYATIFMGKFEEQFIYPAIRGLHRLYLRYIDDIFIIWTGTKERFKEFVKELNLRHPSIKFDYNISNKEVSFLDTIVYIDKNNKLRTKLYKKPTDRQNYLHRASEHPENLKKNIPFSQVLRARRICSEKADFDQACEELRERFIERGYHPDEVEEQIKKTSSVKPRNLSGTKKTSKRIPFVVTYNRTLPPISKILRKHWNILQLDKNLQNLFEEPPVIAYRRCRNLRDLIGGNKLANNKCLKPKAKHTIKKCEPCCIKEGSLCCQQILDTNQFRSHVTGKSYKIYHQVNCKSSNIIYLMDCSKCHKQYVGKAQTVFNLRLNNHRKDVRRTDAIRADRHFNCPDHEFNRDAKFTVIEELKNTDTFDKKKVKYILEKGEDFWMIKLKTIHPDGLNDGLNHPNETINFRF